MQPQMTIYLGPKACYRSTEEKKKIVFHQFVIPVLLIPRHLYLY